MAKYNIENFEDLIKIIKIHVINRKMNSGININYNEFYNIIESKDIIKIINFMKKLNIKFFVED